MSISYESPNQQWKRMKLAGKKTHALPPGGLGTFVMFAAGCATIGAALLVVVGAYLMIVGLVRIPKEASAWAALKDMASYCAVRGGMAGALFATGAWFFKGNWFRAGRRIVSDKEEQKYRAKMGK